jgi:serine/threonine-protein kinase
VRVFLYGQLDDGSLYIVMEFLSGRNLAQVVRAEGPMAFERALPVMIQACGALEEAHRQGIVHRDLKPENIFLCTQGGINDYAKVLDFGLAKVTEREMRPGSLILTQEGMVFGTPEFMSPEQAQGKTLDPRSDIYSLGVILYELLTGKLPFSARVPMEFISLHVNAQPIPLRERAPNRPFATGLQEVLDKALAKNPDDRYQTAAEFAAALRSLLPGGGRGTMSAIPPSGSGGSGSGGGLGAAGVAPDATEPTLPSSPAPASTSKPATAAPPRAVQATTAGWAVPQVQHIVITPKHSSVGAAPAAPPAEPSAQAPAPAPPPAPSAPLATPPLDAVSAGLSGAGATPPSAAAVTASRAPAGAGFPTPAALSVGASPSRAHPSPTGRMTAPSHGPTEFGDSRLSFLDGAPAVRVRRSSAAPVIALVLVGIGAAAAVVAYALSQRGGDTGSMGGLFGGTPPTPLPPALPPPVLPVSGIDGGALVGPNVPDGGSMIGVGATPDGGERDAGQQRDPPETRVPRCPRLADASVKGYARGCAEHLVSMESFSIIYNIDQSGQARVTFGGSPPPAFRSCVIRQAVNLHAPGVNQACRGRFGFP